MARRFAKVLEEEIVAINKAALFLSIWPQLFKRWIALSTG